MVWLDGVAYLSDTHVLRIPETQASRRGVDARDEGGHDAEGAHQSTFASRQTPSSMRSVVGSE
jgi:hypothetical protein